MDNTQLLTGMEEVATAIATAAESGAAAVAEPPGAAASAEPPRLRCPDRAQLIWEAVSLEERVAADHRVRTVWAVVERLDLARFYERIAARGEVPGRAATDPRLLIALWLFATIENVGSARRLEQLCREHDAYRWLCGGVHVNHHTLSDFRVTHERALDDLMTQLIAALVERDLVKVDRISQDSLRVPAAAGSSSFRREKTLRRLLEEARAHVEAVKQQADEAPADAARSAAARQRAAQERLGRVEAALAVLPELQAIKENHTGKPPGSGSRASPRPTRRPAASAWATARSRRRTTCSLPWTRPAAPSWAWT